MEYSDIRAWDRSRSRRDIPALPFFHFEIKAKKPKCSAYPATLDALGDRLKARRLDLGLLQKELAAILDVTAETVCYWENGHVEPCKQHETKIRLFLDAAFD